MILDCSVLKIIPESWIEVLVQKHAFCRLSDTGLLLLSCQGWFWTAGQNGSLAGHFQFGSCWKLCSEVLLWRKSSPSNPSSFAYCSRAERHEKCLWNALASSNCGPSEKGKEIKSVSHCSPLQEGIRSHQSAFTNYQIIWKIAKWHTNCAILLKSVNGQSAIQTTSSEIYNLPPLLKR